MLGTPASDIWLLQVHRPDGSEARRSADSARSGLCGDGLSVEGSRCRILDCQNEPLSGRKIVLLPLAASFVMTAWDFSMDPVWADIDHAWVWRDGGPYYGVPTSNFFGWFLTVYIFYQLFALYLRNRVIMRSPKSHWRLAILFYAASAAGNLLVVAPLSLGSVFVDAAGKHWAIPGILGTSRLVSISLMMPLSADCLIRSLTR